MYSNQLYFVFQVPERLYQLVDRSTDGLVTADQVMEFIAGLQAIRYEKNKLCSVTILRRIATSATHEFPLKRLTAPPPFLEVAHNFKSKYYTIENH